MLIFRNARFALITFAIGSALAAGAWAQTTATSTTTSLPAFTPPSAVQFSAQASANLGAMFGSCMSTGINGIAGALSGNALPNSVSQVAAGLTGGVGGACSGSDQVPNASMGGNSCSLATNADGSFNDQYFQQLLSQGTSVQATINCKLQKFASLQSDLSCMQTQANQLQQQIQGLQTTLQQNITKQETDVATIKGVITDRQNQEQVVSGRLGTASDSGASSTGSCSSSGSGLLGAQSQLNCLLTQMSTTIQTQQAGVQNIQNARNNLTQYAQQKTMMLTAQCFQSTPSPNYQCSVNGGSCSPMQYVLSRVYQNAFLNSNGQIMNDSQTQAQATSIQSELQSVLNNIMSNMATAQSLTAAETANDAASQVNASLQTQTINSPNDIQVQYGASLQKFNGTNFNVYGTIMGAFRNCYATAQTAITQQEDTPGQDLYNKAYAINQQESVEKAQVDQEIQTMSQAYTGAMASLTLTHVPLTTTQCTSATLANEMTCVTDLQANLEGVLQGNTNNSTVSVNIPSTDQTKGSSAISFQCQGINGCITLYRQVQENLGNEVTRLQSAQQAYVQQANAQTDAFLTQIKTSLSGQSQMIQNKMQTLNSQLAAMGVAPISATPYTNTPMTKDGDGLYQMPQDLLATIGGGLVPPLLNMNGDSFQQGLTGISQAQQQEQQQSGQVNQYISQVQELEASCKTKVQASAQTGITNQLQSVISQCSNNQNWCQGGNLDSLTASVSMAGFMNGNTTSLDSILAAGQNGCSTSANNDKGVASALALLHQYSMIGDCSDPVGKFASMSLVDYHKLCDPAMQAYQGAVKGIGTNSGNNTSCAALTAGLKGNITGYGNTFGGQGAGAN